jgi:malate dehydrogenase (oxaloacetate-decarboxylating)(NADP+)
VSAFVDEGLTVAEARKRLWFVEVNGLVTKDRKDLLPHNLPHALNERPVLFALSNPTSRAECTAGQAYQWSRGQAIFASGSPFGTVTYDGREYRVGQGDNSYVFPGIGRGAVMCRARRIPDAIFLTAARTLAGLVTATDLEIGALYPPLREIRRISLAIAINVADCAYTMKLARTKRPRNLRQAIARFMYEP